MGEDDVLAQLSNVPLFSGCGQKELKAVARVMKEIEHGQGDVLAREGDAGVGFFLIKDGTARVSIGGKGRGRLGPGDFFGEMSLLDGGPRSATVTAETPVRLLGLTAWDFRRLLDRQPVIARRLLAVLADRLRQATKAKDIRQ